jgi:RNA polymerase sigma-70 factor (ECF subfamily)
MQVAYASSSWAAHHRSRTGAQVQSDEALLWLISKHEQSAMRILFSRHRVRVFRFALSITKDQSLAEEVVSDVFLDVWRRANSFKGRSQVSTWLLAIARNKALLSMRRHEPQPLDEELADTIDDTTESPEAAMQRRQTRTILADCILQLPAIHREIIDLVYYHQKSIAEAAEILEVPKNTVKTRMFYARKRIAQMLAVKGNGRVSFSF